MARLRLSRINSSRMFRNLDHIFASVADGIVAFDKDLRYIFLNDAAQTMLGVSRAEALGRTPMELFAPGGVADVVGRIRQAIASGHTTQYDAHHKLTDRWFENRIYP